MDCETQRMLLELIAESMALGENPMHNKKLPDLAATISQQNIKEVFIIIFKHTLYTSQVYIKLRRDLPTHEIGLFNIYQIGGVKFRITKDLKWTVILRHLPVCSDFVWKPMKTKELRRGNFFR
jgi:hypothetical protein